uniref:Uncharacterized protein n=1 Tax=Guillardia theta (strain CCMP2712) TaxID=905079 RepID=A0A0C3U8F8_GUITC
MKQYHGDGTCNALPKWEPSFNAVDGSTSDDCTTFPDYGEPGLGYGAKFGSGEHGSPLPPYATS